MELLFRLDPDQPGFENRIKTKEFFNCTLIQNDNSFFYATKKYGEIKDNDLIYFSWKNYIVATAAFLGEIVEDKSRDSIFRFGYKVTDIKIIESTIELDHNIVATRTTYIDTPAKIAELKRVLSHIPQESFVAEDNEEKYQKLVEKCPVQNMQESPRKPVEPMLVNGVLSYKRNAAIAAAAMAKAKYICEIDADHQTFISNYNNRQFTEAHHLIPLSRYSEFPSNDLDTLTNIASLCPNCHRQIHLGRIEHVEPMLRKLLDSRIEGYSRLGIEISQEKLVRIYVNR